MDRMTGILGTGDNQAALDICVADVIDLVERLDDHFTSPQDVALWLRSPLAAFDGQTPESLISQGRAIELHCQWGSLNLRQV